MYRLVVCLVVSVFLSLLLAAQAVPAPGFPRHRCGSFVQRNENEGETFALRISVFNSNHLSCNAAMQVIQAFFEGNVKSHGGPSEVQTYYTIAGFSGWRCFTGAGSGECIRRGKIAGYLNSVA